MKQKILGVKTNNDSKYKYRINRVFLGVFAIIIGLLYLLNSFNLISLNIGFAIYWSLFIIFIGISLLRKNDAISATIGGLIIILSVSLFFFSLISYDVNSSSKYKNVAPITVTKSMNLERAEIELDAIAGEVNVYGINSENLIEGRIAASAIEDDIVQFIDGSTQKVNISLNSGSDLITNKKNLNNQFDIGIDGNVPLNFVLNGGASSNKIDLSEIKAEKVVINTGASDLFLKLGDDIDSDVVIEAGASFINLSLPKTAGVKILTESGFSSQELEGFSPVGNNTYQSLDYNSKERKINIKIEMGMATLKNSWYSPVKKNEVSLFYYNQLKDEEDTCDADYILPVKRSIPEGDTQIEDAINLLIAGKLTEKEKREGFFTEFPNNDFKLLNLNLDSHGVLTLEFSEVPGFTTGGSCRVGILASEIIKTVKQFPEVKKVVFEPETLFEP